MGYVSTRANKTGEFQEAVQRVKKRQHDLQEIMKEETGEDETKEERDPAKKRSKCDDDFEAKGRSIVENVNRLNKFLLENRHAYVDVLNNEWNPDPISDIDRDSIDEGANNFIRTANRLISRFKDDLKNQLKSLRPQRIQHLEAVTDILDEYLRAVTAVHSKQRAIRIEKELEIQKLSRLEVDARKNNTAGGGSTTASTTDFQASKLQRLLEGDTSEEEFADRDDDTEGAEEDREVRSKKRLKRTSSSSAATAGPRAGSSATNPAGGGQKPSVVGYQYSSDDDNEQNGNTDSAFSPDEIKAFEQENEELYEDLMCLKDNVQQIQSQVVKISELQEVFTDKVLQQKDDIDQIAAHAVAATENVRDGNEELRKAIQRNASIRVYILFFLIVMSFSLLFLDWYND